MAETSARAGWAEIDITPPLGLPMGGRGPRFTPGAAVLDPLSAQALVLQDERGKRCLWISLDLIGLDYARSAALRYDLAAQTGIPYSAIILNFAHTHSGPMTCFADYPVQIPEPQAFMGYLDELAGKLRAVVQTALDRLQPVTATIYNGQSDFGINRRRPMPSGEIALAPNPDGFYNPDVWALSLEGNSSERSRCVVFSYGCHAVIAYGAVWDGISADFPGRTRRALQTQLGGDVHCQFVQGLAGNVRPRILADVQAGAFRKSQLADLDLAGAALASDVLAALHNQGSPLRLDLRAAAGWVSLPRDAARAPGREHWKALSSAGDELSRNVGAYWLQRLHDGPPLAQAAPVEIGLLHLAQNTAIAWISAEAVAEWLPFLREFLGLPALTVWGYCQHVSRYLPVDALLPEGGYEVLQANWYDRNSPAPFAPGLEAVVGAGFKSL